MPANKAAWLVGPKLPFEVKDAPYTPPRRDEIVIRNRAIAINPVDWIKQDMGDVMFPWIKYPFILGADVAGEVAEVGSDIKRFKVGDRVLAQVVGVDKGRNSAAEGGFQLYTVVPACTASHIPESLPYESACVVPLGLGTAACGFYEDDKLGLPFPSLNPKPTGKVLVVWGASTSVGCNAVQLGVASGYEVVATASPRNFGLVKKLGASQVFDYNSKTVVQDIINALKGKKVGGAIAIGQGSSEKCLDIVHKCAGDKVVTVATYPGPPYQAKHFKTLVMIYYYLGGLVSNWVKSKTRGIKLSYIFGSTLYGNKVGPAIYEDYLPEALAEGTFVTAPEAEVFGTGLESIQAACDLQKKGVSAKKIVVTL